MAKNTKKKKEEEKYPILKAHKSVRPSLYNALDWTITYGHAVSSLGLLLGYYASHQGGNVYFEKYKIQRRICLFTGIGCGLVSVLMEGFESHSKLKILDCADRYPFAMWPARILNLVGIPLFTIYVEFLGGSEQSSYAFYAILVQYLEARFATKFRTDYYISYFKQAKDENTELRKKLS